MKIYGPYKDGSGKRLIVLKYFDDGKKKTTSLARHLMEESLGRELTSTETVDHINGDPMDNRLENLQILSRADNIRKSAKPAEIFQFFCPICGVKTSKPMRDVRHSAKQGKAGPFCGKKCARRYQLLRG
jgi:hypothetical protein